MTIEQRLQQMEQDIQYLKSQLQTKMDCVPIKPGCSPKVYYDENGRVVGNGRLTVEDIPDIPIGKVSGLGDILLGLGKRSIDHSQPLTRQSLPKLEEDDIPPLAIDKIRDLGVELNQIHSKIDSLTVPMPSPAPVYTYDGNKVTSFEDASMMENLASRLSSVESQVTRFATTDVVDALKASVEHKANASSVSPGKYSQVMVNSDGIVTSGKNIPMDLANVSGLEDVLRGKADQSEFVSLQESVSFIVKKLASDSTSDESNGMNTSLENIEKRISRLERLLDPS